MNICGFAVLKLNIEKLYVLFFLKVDEQNL
jgi:hypothetical protein